MFEIISKSNNLYNVLDTEDGVVEAYSFLDIISCIQSGVDIKGVFLMNDEYVFEIDGLTAHKIMKGYKFRLYLNKEQQTYFQKCFGCCRFLWNHMLADKIAYYDEYKESLNTQPPVYKADFPFLKEVDSLALTSEYRDLNTAFKNFLEIQVWVIQSSKINMTIISHTPPTIKKALFLLQINMLDYLRSVM